jgi:hypothetical protein
VKVLGTIVLPLFLLAAGCPLADQTQFWHRNGAVFTAQNVPIYRVNIESIVVYWHPGSGSAVLRDPAVDQGKVIWKILPIRPVQFAGFRFELFKTPPSFKVDVDRENNLPHTGVFSVEVQGVVNAQKRVLLYHEFSAESLARTLKED